MRRLNEQTTRLYKKFRQHQQDVQAAGGGTLTTYPEGRTELSYASAPYGERAVCAFSAAKRHAHFLTRLSR